MEKVLAKVILQSVLSLDKGSNDLDPLVRDIKDPKKDDRLPMCLGTVTAELNAEIDLPIVPISGARPGYAGERGLANYD